MRTKLTSLLGLALAGLATAASAQVACPTGAPNITVPAGSITANTTWSGHVLLQGPVFVKNGAILTILPGTVVRGQPRSAAVAAGSVVGTPGTLIVTQNGRLIADGVAATSAIIMTTAATDNDDNGVADDADVNGFKDSWDPGDAFLDDTCTTAPLAPLDKAGNANVALWGGVAILGSAPTNNADKAGIGYGLATVEGLTVPGFPAADATYGGPLPHDNSGIVRFVSIRHAGDEIGNSNELNGLTLAGVGDGTTIENVEVYANFDDAFEWFGGTVNARNLAAFFVGDDSFDVDEGYTGVNQNLFTIMSFFNENDGGAFGSASSDKAGEFDGDNYRPDNTALNNNVNTRINIQQTVVDASPWPLSNFAFYNVTVIGSTPDGAQDFVPTSAASTNRGLQFRNGSAGDVFNSLIVNTGNETGIEVDTGATGAPGFDAITNANNGLINVVCTTMDDGAALAAQENTVIANGDALSVVLGANAAASANAVNPANAFDLTNDDTTFNPTGNAAGKLVASLKSARIDPRPGALSSAGCAAPRGTGLAPQTFRGAFQRLVPLWTNGWTSLSQGGLL